jgi:hypothetical protein
MARDDRQLSVTDWARSTFGDDAMCVRERVLRFIEEATELVQSEGLSEDDVQRVVAHVFSKPPGNPAQEVGGVGVTLLAYCGTVGTSADTEEQREWERVRGIDPAYFRRRHNAKADVGIAVRAAPPSPPPAKPTTLRHTCNGWDGSLRCIACDVGASPNPTPEIDRVIAALPFEAPDDKPCATCGHPYDYHAEREDGGRGTCETACDCAEYKPCPACSPAAEEGKGTQK